MTLDTTTLDRTVPTRTLWFGVAASVAAWFGLYLADILITWLTCPQRDQLGGPESRSSSPPPLPSLYSGFVSPCHCRGNHLLSELASPFRHKSLAGGGSV